MPVQEVVKEAATNKDTNKGKRAANASPNTPDKPFFDDLEESSDVTDVDVDADVLPSIHHSKPKRKEANGAAQADENGDASGSKAPDTAITDTLECPVCVKKLRVSNDVFNQQ